MYEIEINHTNKSLSYMVTPAFQYQSNPEEHTARVNYINLAGEPSGMDLEKSDKLFVSRDGEKILQLEVM